MQLHHPLVLLLPHLVQQRQSLIVGLLPLKRVQGLYQYLLHTRIPSHSQQLLDCLHELRVHVPRKCLPWIVGQDADEHNAIVLHVRLRRVVFREVLSDDIGCSLCSGRRRLAGFDNRWEVKDFFALLELIKLALPIKSP